MAKCTYMVHVIVSYTMGMSGLPNIYTQSQRAAGPRIVRISSKPRIHMVLLLQVYVPYSPSPDELEAAQARKCASLQAHCIYREGCWD